MRLLSFLVRCVLILCAIGVIAGWLAYQHFSQGLPDFYQLARYNPPLVTRVHAGDGRLMAEYAIENRVYVPVSAVPKRVVNAFLSSEDKTFYSHSGIDIPSVVRAAWVNFRNLGSERRPIGASTITQQVAKNFLLTNEVSYQRKIKEAILSLRIERAFAKDRILELYLNHIYLGSGNYGVASASINYFNKSLDELTISEAAYLAGLPKAPNEYNLKRRPEAARARRDWVIDRMLENHAISPAEGAAAKAEPLVERARGETELYVADYFAEEIRREIAEKFTEDGLYKKGLVVRATIEPRLQEIADHALRRALVAYDRAQGYYRGPLKKIGAAQDWQAQLAALEPMPWLYDWRPGVILSAGEQVARIGFAGGEEGQIPLEDLAWARRVQAGGRLGPTPNSTADVFEVGDLVAVASLVKDEVEQPGFFSLQQVPEISGALVAIDPHTGRVLAMTGGWSYRQSEFNRASQAQRQPGSAFKPIVYLAALEAGYTPSTVILDAPIVIDQGPGLPLWKPENFEQKYLGPTTMRRGLEMSRNLMTIRMAQTLGMARVAEMAERLGVTDRLQQTLAMSIGAGETTVVRLASAYAMMVNGGKKITPTFIDRVQDNQGWTIYRHDQRACAGCQAAEFDGGPPPFVPDDRQQVLDPAIAYQMVSMLEGVVLRGTGTALKPVGKPLAGKTGTTNDARDVWFIGFSPDLVAGVYLGFDQPRSLGRKATGGRYAAPIIRDFMMEALKDKPATPFRVAPGIRLVRVNLNTGERAQAGDERIILEAFRPGTEPNEVFSVIEGISDYGEDAGYGSIIPLGEGRGEGDSGGSVIDLGRSGIVSGIVTGQQPGTVTGDPAPDAPFDGVADSSVFGAEDPGAVPPGGLGDIGSPATDPPKKVQPGASPSDSDSGLY